jgi:hypothetical protein
MDFKWSKFYKTWENSSEESVINMISQFEELGYLDDLKSEEEIPVMEESSPLVFLLYKNYFEALKKLISYGVSINLLSEEDGGSAFFHLINNRKFWNDDERFRFCKYLLTFNADPTIGFNYLDPIAKAAFYGDFDIYSMFLKQNENIGSEHLLKTISLYNQDNSDSRTALDRTKMNIMLSNPDNQNDNEETSQENEQKEQKEGIENSGSEETLSDEEGLALLDKGSNNKETTEDENSNEDNSENKDMVNQLGLSEEELEAFLGMEESGTQSSKEDEEMIPPDDDEVPQVPPVLKKKQRKMNLD